MRKGGGVKRTLFSLCSGISLLLFVAVCGLWVISYWRGDQFTWKFHEPAAGRFRRVYVRSGGGGLLFVDEWQPAPPNPDRLSEWKVWVERHRFEHVTNPWPSYPWHDRPRWATL